MAIAHDPDWSVGATIQDCANDTEPGNEAVADLPGLFWDNTTAAATPHRPATPDETAQLGEPLLVWRAVCNKSTMPAAQLLVQWTRALCINAENCLNATEIGFSTIPAQAICACTPAFLEDVVGDTPDEVAGLYRYALLYNGVELASAIVVVR